MPDYVCIYGYGSILWEPGPELETLIAECIPHISPWHIEYARSSLSREGAPTLVFYGPGGNVEGQILRLNLEVNSKNVNMVKRILHERDPFPARY